MNRLRDDEARALAERYGVPINPVTFVDREGQFTEPAEGYFAIKLVANGVVHKAASGGVILNVPGNEVAKKAKELIVFHRDADIDVTGVTIEQMVDPGLELVIGGVDNPNFGPMVMFGQGGVDIEVIKDLAFALAPFERDDAETLILATRAGNILNQRFPDKFDAVVRALIAVGGSEGLLLSEPIAEIDLNPVVINGETCVAVDARASTSAPGKSIGPTNLSPQAIYGELSRAVYPQSVVIVGASTNPAKLGGRAVRNLVDFGFDGDIFPVHPSADNICGIPAISGISEIPLGIDRAIVALPADKVPQALNDLAEREVLCAHILTADTPPIDADLRNRGLRVIGPNSMGHYTPYRRMSMLSPASSSKIEGGVAFVSQSGTYASDAVRRGKELGINFSFVTSVGNCEDLAPSEMLAFCEADPRTEIIAFYIEDDRDAGAFFRLAKACVKPILLFKGGRTEAGAAAAASHTGALVGDQGVLENLAAQAGVQLVGSIEQLLDALQIFQQGRILNGGGLGLVGSGGGVAVVGSDEADKYGMSIPRLSAATLGALRRFDAPGVSLTNPIDIPVWSLYDSNGAITEDLLGVIADDPAIGALCSYLCVGSVFDMLGPTRARTVCREIVEGILSGTPAAMPSALVLRSGYSREQEDLIRELRDDSAEREIPVYPTIGRAVGAIAMLRAHQLSQAVR